MPPCQAHFPQHHDRRHFLLKAGGGIGGLELAGLLQQDAQAAKPSEGDPLAPRNPHLAPRAKRVIWLFMHNGPSHMDLFDPKPDLAKHAGQPLPVSFGEVMTRRKVAKNPLLGPIKPFQPRGQSGLEISDFLPHIASHADELCVMCGCHGDSVNHPQSVYQMNTGSILMGKPSLGAWVEYGLGTENRDMPAFVVLPDPGGGLKGGPPAWGSGFLPGSFQATTLRPGANPILNLKPPADISGRSQRRMLDLIGELNRDHLAARDFDDRLAARVNAYELAFRMQSAAPEIVDISRESEATRRLYGIGQKETTEFGTRCLLARRMIEKGVRFVQLYSGDTGGWDAHSNVLENHTKYCRRTDLPIAGLLTDLKARGLLRDTLAIWGGEIGRMPMSEQGTGRDHNPWGYSVWLAGAGVRGGMAHGATDPVGLRAEQNKVHVHDLHETILHALGITRLARGGIAPANWSLKSMHRLLLNSATYRQASRSEEDTWEKRLDAAPENRLYSRMNRRRLDGETLRDTLLAISGQATQRADGPGVRPPLPREITSALLNNQWPVSKSVEDHHRRSVYLFTRRNLRYPLFELFDRPAGTASCSRRMESTSAPQSLILLNSDFSVDRAVALAKRLAKRDESAAVRDL